MFNFKSKRACREVEALFNDIQINLENNYKDLAIGARKNAEQKLAELRESGELGDKDYKRLKQRLDDFTKRMEGYHH